MVRKNCKRLAEVDSPIAMVSARSSKGEVLRARILQLLNSCWMLRTRFALQSPNKATARLDWNKIKEVADYYLSVNAMKQPMQVREDAADYGDRG